MSTQQHPRHRLLAWNPIVSGFPFIYFVYLFYINGPTTIRILGFAVVLTWFALSIVDFATSHRYLDWLYSEDDETGDAREQNVVVGLDACCSVFSFISKLFNRWRQPKTPYLSADAASSSDADLAWAVFEAAGDSLNAAGGSFGSKVRYLPPQWRFVWTLLYLDGQVNNGGFHQFFANSAGRFDSHLANDTSLLRHTEYRDLIQRALRLYSGIDYSDQWDNLGKSWDKFAAAYKEGRFDDEDSAYYKLEPDLDEAIGSQIRETLADYLDANHSAA